MIGQTASSEYLTHPLCVSQDSIPYGKAVLVAEVCRPSPSATSSDVAKLAADYVAWGVDAIAVATDLEDTPGGLQDLFAVCRAVKVPVLQWDWFLHPIQVSWLAVQQHSRQVAGKIILGHSTSDLMCFFHEVIDAVCKQVSPPSCKPLMLLA